MTKITRSDVLSIVFWIAFGGLLVWGFNAATAKKSEKSIAISAAAVDRRATVAATLSKGPQTTSWNTPEGKVIELSIPTSRLGGLMIEVKRCIVWRGQGADSLHCESEAVLGTSQREDVDYSDLR